MRSALIRLAAAAVLAAVLIMIWQYRQHQVPAWTEAEVAVMRSLWLESLPRLPPDPSNAVADNPEAAELGRLLFFDTRLSANGAVSCATCHQPARNFTDGLPKARAIGVSKRNTPSIVGTAYSPWLYWDGRRDSQWAQALSPLEDTNEHGTDREQVVAVVFGDPGYGARYRALFGDAVDTDVAFSNIGKAIAAFERTIMPAPSRFDRYVAAIVNGDSGQRSLMRKDELRGLRLFIGEAGCLQCHNGPLLTNNEFHNTGLLNYPGDEPDKGCVAGVRQAFADPFNCRGPFSDDPERRCDELEYARTGPELTGAFRTPSLRNLEGTAPFMHKGQLATLADVLRHYNEAPDAMIGHNEAEPLRLSKRELRQLEAFLGTLSAPSTFQLDSM